MKNLTYNEIIRKKYNINNIYNNNNKFKYWSEFIENFNEEIDNKNNEKENKKFN